MVVVVRSKAVSTLREFIKDLLVNNLTDTQDPPREPSEWVFVGEEREDRVVGNMPRVYIVSAAISDRPLNQAQRGPCVFETTIKVLASGISAKEDRDNLLDQIREVLLSETLDDGTHTLRHKNLQIDYNSPTPRTEISDYESDGIIWRAGEINVRYNYFGL
jgi:hypothetical protein